jgi:mono/diheme cytochrome c family protein
MKRLFLVLLLVVMASAMALAGPITQGAHPTSSGAPGAVAPTVDVLGAHQNYGRGCAGCHAPHSGAWGEGGNALTGTVTDAYTGVNALFGQDMGPLWGQTFDFSDVSNTGSANRYLLATAANSNPTQMNAQQYADMRGVVMCLACHDGAVAKGAMMQNWAFEEQIGALPSSYGIAKIPTLLGADGTTNLGSSTDGGNYNNDHPIGESATISAVLGSYYNNATNGLTYVVASGAISSITPAGQYSQFIASYGAPALLKGAHSYGTPVNATNVPYVVCTTCHDQHSMNVYSVVGGTGAGANTIAGNSTGTYAKYFFINGPYNPNTVNIPLGSAASTTQFCRQCHFGESNEANGGTLPTVF